MLVHILALQPELDMLNNCKIYLIHVKQISSPTFDTLLFTP